MNDAEYPRRQAPLGFDRMAQAPRPGDRSRREDDRYIFLEALLSARDRLVVSYVGRSARDNSLKLPSVLVSELLDALERGFIHPDGGLREHVVVEHPLQPFSPACFGTDHGHLFSYAAEWQAGARALQAEPAEPPFVTAPLPAPDEALREVDIDALVRFFRNPAQAFLRYRLGVFLQRGGDAMEDDEAFAADFLDVYRRKQALLERVLAGGTMEDGFETLRGEGQLPFGPFGRREFERYREAVEPFAEVLEPRLRNLQPPLDVDLALDGFRLAGRIEPVTGDGLLRYRLARLSAADRLRLWIEHLAVNAVAHPSPSLYLAEDKAFRLRPLEAAAARDRLAELLDAYWQGLCAPLPLFPNTSFAFAEKRAAGRTDAEAMKAALYRWEDNPNTFGEGADVDVCAAFRGRDPLDGDFERWAQAVFGPMLDGVDGG